MKTVKVFVSSLFNEMARERDMLHRQVSALINSKLDKNQDFSVLFVDLRWGIDNRNKVTNYEKSDYVLEKCFEAIRDCDLFLGIIGQKFGSIANSDAIKNYLREEPDHEESYTSLEIKYAAQYLPANRMFFMMTAPSAEDELLVQRMKGAVSSKYRTLFYHRDNSSGVISNEFLTGITDLVLSAINQLDSGTMETPSQYFSRSRLLKKCRAAIGDNNLVVLKGSSGCGKSVVIKMLINEFQQSSEYITLVSDNAFYNFSHTITSDLRKWTGKETSLEKMLNALQKSILFSSKPYIIFVDSIDHIDITEFFSLYSKIIQIPKSKVTVFFATSSNYMMEYIDGLDILSIDADKLDECEIVPFAKFIAQQSNKMLFPEICEVLQNSEGPVYNAFYLSALVRHLLVLNSEELAEAHLGNSFLDSLCQKMIRAIDNLPKDVEGILFEQLQDIGSYANKDFATFLFELMCALRLPLPIELARGVYKILKDKEWSDLDYYVFRFYLKGLIIELDGTLRFSHGIVDRCITSFYNKSNEMYYLEGIYRFYMENSPKDSLFFLAAARIQKCDDIVYGIMDKDKRESVISVLPAVLYLDRGNGSLTINGDLNEKSSSWVLFTTIYEKNGLDDAIDILEGLITAIFWNADLPLLMFFFKAFSMINSKDTSLSKLMRILALLAQFLLDNSFEQYGAPVAEAYFNILERVRNTGMFFSDLVISSFEDATYYVSDLLINTDQKVGTDLLLHFSTELIKHSRQLKEYYPSIIQNVQNAAPDLAKDICNYLSEKFEYVTEERDLKIYGNLLYAQVGLFGAEGNLEATEKPIQRLFDIYTKLYEEDSLDYRNLYNYGLALSASIMLKECREDPTLEQLRYKELISIRKHLCKIRPDSYDNIRCLANTIMNAIMNKVDVGDSYVELLEEIYQHIAALAKRGNPRSCWLISSLFFHERQKEEIVYQFFLTKLQEIEIFLNPIMELNRGNTDYVEEIIYTYLRIYRQYCNLQILPLDVGHHLLYQLYSFAKQEILAEMLSKDYSDIRLSIATGRVYLELFGVLLSESKQANHHLITKDEEYIDFRKFSEEYYNKHKCPESELLLSIAESVDVLCLLDTYSELHSKKGAFSIFNMVASSFSFSIEATMLDYCSKAIALWESIFASGIKIPPDIFSFVHGCVEVLSRDGKTSEVKKTADKLKTSLLPLLPDFPHDGTIPIWQLG